VTVVNPDNVEAVAPNATFVDPMVTELFVSDALPIFDNVLVDPLIDLLVRVWAPVKVATVLSMSIVTAEAPV